MNKRAVSIVHLFLLFLIQNSQQAPCQCGKSCVCSAVPNKSQLLNLIDQDLYVEGLKGVGQCKIFRNSGSGVCDLYVNSGIKGVGSYSGYPLNKECKGTGCVKAPDFPKGGKFCWYSRSEYSSSVQSRADKYCTDSGVANAAAQLRDAIKQDACNCQAKAAPKPTPTPTPRFRGYPDCDYQAPLEVDDWNEGTFGRGEQLKKPLCP